jgi:hypothetical protein
MNKFSSDIKRVKRIYERIDEKEKHNGAVIQFSCRVA